MSELKLKGYYSINGERQDNMIMNNLAIGIFNLLKLSSTSLTITALAIGTGTTAPAKTQTSLVSELARFSLADVDTGTQEVTFNFSIPDNVTYDFKEVGVFAGSTMLSRALLARRKTAGAVMNISWTLKLEY